jgi:hypothetical protein
MEGTIIPDNLGPMDELDLPVSPGVPLWLLLLYSCAGRQKTDSEETEMTITFSAHYITVLRSRALPRSRSPSPLPQQKSEVSHYGRNRKKC